MSAPTQKVRAATYERDGHACVSCGRTIRIEYQHRGAVGNGGSKIRPRVEEGVTSCSGCNPKYEHVWQTLALARGWKVRKWVIAQGRADEVPIFYRMERVWCVLTTEGDRVAISPAAAEEMMRDVYGDEWDRWEQELAA